MANLSNLETRVIGGGDSGFVTTKFDALLNWARKYSLFQYPFATACCGMEFFSTASPRYDIARFGAEFPRFSPRQADLLMVVGTINLKQAPILKRVYEQMTEPKWVVSFGVCASSGGFYDNYAVLQGIDRIIPVDVYIPGCPPRPEQILDGLILLQDKIQNQRHYLGNKQPIPERPGYRDLTSNEYIPLSVREEGRSGRALLHQR